MATKMVMVPVVAPLRELYREGETSSDFVYHTGEMVNRIAGEAIDDLEAHQEAGQVFFLPSADIQQKQASLSISAWGFFPRGRQCHCSSPGEAAHTLGPYASPLGFQTDCVYDTILTVASWNERHPDRSITSGDVSFIVLVVNTQLVAAACA